MTPALEPNPSSASRNTTLRAAGESAGAAARRSPKSVVTAPAASSKKAAIRRANPAWVMARYHPPAWMVSGSSGSVRTRKYEVRDMPSHIMRKVSTLPAQRAAALVHFGVRDPVDGARNGDEADEAEEEGAQSVEPEYEAVRDREERGHLEDERRSADEDLEGEAEARPASHHGPRRDQAARDTAARGQHRDGGPERVPSKHEAEQKHHWWPGLLARADVLNLFAQADVLNLFAQALIGGGRWRREYPGGWPPAPAGSRQRRRRPG